jgi:glucose-6-phosphate isomerase
VCSAVGLPIAIAYGFDVFRDFLAGCHAADIHALETPYARNIPVLMALLTVWYRSFLGYGALAIVPYSQRLARFSDYMQQLGMESNGKRVDRDSKVVDYATAPVIFGQVGTNGQHAFFQMLHQGPDTIPVEFIGAREPHGCPARHKVLLANMFAQSRALMLGKAVSPEKSCPGNRPSTTILLPKLDAYNLGLLLAVYEHKTAAEGFLWNLNSFDQYGVELGKELAKELLAHDNVLAHNESLDFSTNKLIFHTFTSK